jgi:hypothetical protein
VADQKKFWQFFHGKHLNKGAIISTRTLTWRTVGPKPMILCTWNENEGLISFREITSEETNWQKYGITVH